MTARQDLQRLLDILDDVLAGYCEACRMAPCVCVRPTTAEPTARAGRRAGGDVRRDRDPGSR